MKKNLLNPNYRIGPIEAIVRFWKNYFNFSGRATRSEFWWWWIANFFAFFALSFVDAFISVVLGAGEINPMVVWALATLIPSWSLEFRRLHDVGLSGAWSFLPFAGIAIWLTGGVLMNVCRADVDMLADVAIVGILFVGWLFVLGGGIFLFICALKDSQPWKNRYGDSEKYPERTAESGGNGDEN